MIFAQFPNWAIGTDNASNRTLGSRDGNFLNRESGPTGPIFPQFGIGQSGRTMSQLRQWVIGTVISSSARMGHRDRALLNPHNGARGPIFPRSAIFALRSRACARSTNRIEGDLNGVLTAWPSSGGTIAITTTPWHLGQGEEKKHDPWGRFIEPLELPCEVQRVSVRAL
jgi:hypothetical protein